ncbi:TPA: hypothetical protein ACH3X3_006603 [Trebouxia sp. C0006]
MGWLNFAHKALQPSGSITRTGDAVLVNLSSSDGKVNVQLLTSRAAMTQEKTIRRKEAAARLQHSKEMKSQEHMLRNKIASTCQAEQGLVAAVEEI